MGAVREREKRPVWDTRPGLSQKDSSNDAVKIMDVEECSVKSVEVAWWDLTEDDAGRKKGN